MIKHSPDKTFFSFEVFPPKKDDGIEKVYATLDELSDLKPDFISVTYGAGGSENCGKTLDIARRINDVCHVESVIHLPGLHLTKAEAGSMLKSFSDNGIENLLVLRGDKIEGRKPCGDFLHASDLITFIEEKMPGKFHIMAACYPEIHPESKDIIEEINNLKLKVNCGASHLLSQLFFDNEGFFKFIENCKIAGINVPVEAGIMPVTNRLQIERMTARCGVVLPEKYRLMMEKYGNDDEAIMEAGIIYASNQIIELLAGGVDGIHLYTMNKPEIARRIAKVFSILMKNP